MEPPETPTVHTLRLQGDGVSQWSSARSLPAQVYGNVGIPFKCWGLLWAELRVSGQAQDFAHPGL